MKNIIKIIIVFFYFLHLMAQEDSFLKYGPFHAQTFTDLKIALKSKQPVYRLELKNVTYEAKIWDKFGELLQLMSLRLFNNQLSSWPMGLNRCQYLCFLASYLNPISTFPSDLKNFPSLQYIDIQHSKIDSIPAQIAYLQQLKVLKIGNTGDTLYLPRTLKFLKNLRELHFENIIPDSNWKRVYLITGLTVLSVSASSLSVIPPGISKMKNLDVLILDDNQLTKLPWEIGLLKQLRILRLANNKIQTLPDTLTELENLAVLDLRGNPIPPEEIEKLKALLPGCEIKF